MTPVTHLNPQGLSVNPAFSQAVKVSGPASLVFVGGQNGVGADGSIEDDAAAQTRQALRNVELAVAAAGGSLAHIVKWTISVTQPAALAAGFAAFRETWGDRPDPPALSVQVVANLANARFLVEIDAVAAIRAE
jgi:enamine deaminase RidA (YjgF/YER057c/UK114 family)